MLKGILSNKFLQCNSSTMNVRCKGNKTLVRLLEHLSHTASQSFAWNCLRSLNSTYTIHLKHIPPLMCAWCLTCHWWAQQHWPTLHYSDQSHGWGEPCSSHQVHEGLKQNGTQPAEGKTKEDGVNHKSSVVIWQWCQDMTNSIVEDGSGKEVLYSGSDPLGVGQYAHRGPGKHIHKCQNWQQEGCFFFADVLTLSIIGEKDKWSKEAKEHDNISTQVQQEATVFEQCQVNEWVDGLQNCFLWLD